MKLDYTSVENLIKSNKWHSETAPAVLQYCLGFTNGYVNLCRWLGIKAHSVEILHITNKLGVESSILKERGNVFGHLRKKGVAYLRRKYNLWRKIAKKLISLQKEASNLTNKTNKQLMDFYKQALSLDIKQWSFSILSESADNFSNYELLPYLKEELSKRNIYPSTKELSDAAFYLCLEPKLSFMQIERLSFLDICRKLISNKGKVTENIRNICKKHSEGYYWIANNYQRAKIIPANEFLALAQKHIRDIGPKKVNEECTNLKKTIGTIKKKKGEYQKKYKFSKKTLELLDLLALIGKINDERKEINLRTTDIYFRIFKEIQKRKKVSVDELIYYTPKEIESLLPKNKKVKRNEIRNREKHLFFVVKKEGFALFSGDKAKNLIKLFEKQKSTIHDLRGFVACNGGLDRFRGKVSIVKDPKKETLTVGNILVTTMTRPDFVPLMRKSSAIITDEGGISCHAAIVSRELNIPCVVGVQAGTKILKNNDMVEMNLRHGLVRKVIK